MTITATATQLILTDESLIASMVVDGEVLDFTAYVNSLSDVNASLTMTLDNGSFISSFLSYDWSSGETTQAITTTPTVLGDLTRSVIVNDGVTDTSASKTIDIVVEGDGGDIPVASRDTAQKLYLYLKSEGYVGQLNDVIMEWLADQGAGGSYNDKWDAYLSVQGFTTGGLQDKLSQWKNE